MMKTSKAPTENKLVEEELDLISSCWTLVKDIYELYIGKSTDYKVRGYMLYVHYEIWLAGIFKLLRRDNPHVMSVYR